MTAFFLAVRAFLGKLPREVWYALALALAVWLAFRWYDGQIDAAEKRGAQAENARLTAKALELKRNTDALTRKIADTLRSRNDDQARRIAAAADDLRLRGPGKATCASQPVIPAVAGGQQSPARPGGTAVDRMPDAPRLDIIGLPFADTIALAEQHDRCRADLLTYREWEKQVRAAWPQ